MFNFSFFVLRPAIAWALNLFILLFGAVCMSKLPWEGNPTTPSKIVKIEANLSGTQVESMQYIAEILENCMAGSNGLEVYQSAVRTGNASVTGEYNKDVDINAVIVYILQRIQNQQGFPREMRNPTISGTDEQKSTIAIRFAIYPKHEDDGYEMQKIQMRIAKILKSEISAIDGVSDCTGAELAGKACLHMDPDLMLRYRVPFNNVYTALINMRNKSIGKITNAQSSMEIQLGNGLSQDIDQILSTTVRNIDGNSIKLKDFAQIEFMTGDDEKSVSRVNGKKALLLSVLCKDSGNPVNISKNVKEVIAKFQETEKNFEIITFQDEGQQIEDELYSLFKTILFACIIVVIVVGLLLGSLRATLITMIALPFSLIGTFIFMYLFGFTINNYTLFALIIAVGLLIDDALIMVEATDREIENGLSPVEATFKALKDLQSALIGMTLTLAAVFLPTIIANTHDKPLLEFAVSLAISVIISGFVSLVLTPTMCASLLQAHKKTTSLKPSGQFHYKNFWNDIQYYTMILVRYSNSALKSVESFYQSTLASLLMLRYYVAGGITAVTLIGLALIWNTIPRAEPHEEQSIIYVQYVSPAGASLQYCEARMSEIVDVIKPYAAKYADLYWSEVRVGQGSYAALLLPPIRSRKYHTDIQKLEEEIHEKVRNIVPGIEVRSNSTQDKTAEFLELIISGRFSDTEHMDNVASDALKKIAALNIFSEAPIISHQFSPKDYYDITLDHQKCIEYGISTEILGLIPAHIVYGHLTEGDQQIEMTADFLPKSYPISKAKNWTTQIPASDIEKPLVDELPRSNPQALLRSIYVEAHHKDFPRERKMLPLSHFATAVIKTQPMALYRYKGQLAVFLTGKLKPGIGSIAAYNSAEKAIKSSLESGLMISAGGNARKQAGDQNEFFYLIIISLICIFLFLVVLFESFIDPIITFFTIPLAAFGGFFILWWYGGSFGTFTRMGLLTLIGLIAKHGILIVEVSNAHLAAGHTLYNAVLLGSQQRLRPILMTTIAMILGMIDLIFDEGIYAEARKQMAIFIISGLTIGTLLTIIVIPCAYIIVKQFVAYIKSK